MLFNYAMKYLTLSRDEESSNTQFCMFMLHF